jgi:hypothetical protein
MGWSGKYGEGECEDSNCGDEERVHRVGVGVGN